MTQETGNGHEYRGDGTEEFDPRQKVQQFAEEAGAQMEQARMFFEDMNEKVIQFVRERPGAALFGALALGYVVGKIASKGGR